jgi:hypothetical protein
MVKYRVRCVNAREDDVATDASAVLGAPQLAGGFVNPKGFARRVTATVAGGAVAGAIGSAIAGGSTSTDQGVPDFGRVGYVAVTADEVALVKTKSGMLKMKLTDIVLAREPRSEIVSAELKRGALVSSLTIQFSGGGEWKFDVPKANQRGAVQIIEALGGTMN